MPSVNRRSLIKVVCLGAVLAGFPVLSAQSDVANAGTYAGSDIGAKINNAFAAATAGAPSGTVAQSWTVIVPINTSGAAGTFSTPIQIPSASTSPAIFAPVLDCQGGALTYTGTGDAIIVHGENSTGPATSGAIRNCTIYGSALDSGAASLIHIKDRIGFSMYNIHLENATSCLDWENTTSDGGPGYNEDLYFEEIQSSGCLKHINMHAGPGNSGSFRYNTINNWHFSLRNDSASGAETGLSMSGPGLYDVAGGSYKLLVNSTTGSPSGPPVSLVYITDNITFFRSVVNLQGENTAGIPMYSVYVNYGLFFNQGNNTVEAPIYGNTSEANRYNLHPETMTVSNDLGVDSALHLESEYNVFQRQCKTDLATGGMGTRFWLASYGGNENNCPFQILSRNTDDTNQDVYHAGTGSTPVNIFYVNGQSKSVGIGPGFGANASGAPGVGTGNQQPGATLDIHGTLSVSDPTPVGSSLASVAIRSINHQGGGFTDFFQAGNSGQPTPPYQQVFYDTTAYTYVTGFTAFAAGGQVHNFVYAMGNTRDTPSSSSDACVQGESWDDANYHYHCVATNSIKRVALSSF